METSPPTHVFAIQRPLQTQRAGAIVAYRTLSAPEVLLGKCRLLNNSLRRFEEMFIHSTGPKERNFNQCAAHILQHMAQFWSCCYFQRILGLEVEATCALFRKLELDDQLLWVNLWEFSPFNIHLQD